MSFQDVGLSSLNGWCNSLKALSRIRTLFLICWNKQYVVSPRLILPAASLERRAVVQHKFLVISLWRSLFGHNFSCFPFTDILHIEARRRLDSAHHWRTSVASECALVCWWVLAFVRRRRILSSAAYWIVIFRLPNWPEHPIGAYSRPAAVARTTYLVFRFSASWRSCHSARGQLVRQLFWKEKLYNALQ